MSSSAELSPLLLPTSHLLASPHVDLSTFKWAARSSLPGRPHHQRFPQQARTSSLDLGNPTLKCPPTHPLQPPPLGSRFLDAALACNSSPRQQQAALLRYIALLRFTSVYDFGAISLMSAPQANAFSPAPVIMITFTPCCLSNCSAAWTTLCMTWRSPRGEGAQGEPWIETNA